MTDRPKPSRENGPASSEQRRFAAQPLPTDAARAHVAAALQPLDAGAKDRLIARGDLFLRGGFPDLAVGAYAKAGAIDKILGIADQYLDEGRLDLAQHAYAAAGQEISKEQIVAYFKKHHRS